jgi:hypothetical protein
VARRARPVVLAHERVIPLEDPLSALLPDHGLRRGAVVVVDGGPGKGATSVAFTIAAAVTALGEWAAAVDLAGTLGVRAAAEAGVALERFALVRQVPLDRWAMVVATLLDGTGVVLAEMPPATAARDAHRLVARARERDSVLVPLVGTGVWPAEAAVRIHAGGGAWSGLGPDAGLLEARSVVVRVEGRGAAGHGSIGRRGSGEGPGPNPAEGWGRRLARTG